MQRNWVLDGGSEAEALRGLGATVMDAGCEYEIPLDNAQPQLERLQDALDRRRPLEPGQSVSGWQPGHALEVRSICRREKLADTAVLDGLLTPGGPRSLLNAGSAVATENGRLVGFFLTCEQGGRASAPVRWVAPTHRNSWVNARLFIHSLMARPHYRHLDRLHFRCDLAEHRDTYLQVRRFGGDLIARSVRMGLNVPQRSNESEANNHA